MKGEKGRGEWGRGDGRRKEGGGSRKRRDGGRGEGYEDIVLERSGAKK